MRPTCLFLVTLCVALAPACSTTSDGDSASECELDSDCSLGHVCTSGQCVPGCDSDGDCPDGESCVDGSCLSDDGTVPDLGHDDSGTAATDTGGPRLDISTEDVANDSSEDAEDVSTRDTADSSLEDAPDDSAEDTADEPDLGRDQGDENDMDGSTDDPAADTSVDDPGIDRADLVEDSPPDIPNDDGVGETACELFCDAICDWWARCGRTETNCATACAASTRIHQLSDTACDEGAAAVALEECGLLLDCGSTLGRCQVDSVCVLVLGMLYQCPRFCDLNQDNPACMENQYCGPLADALGNELSALGACFNRLDF